MSSNEIRKKFLEFFKAHEHAVVPSSSLVPDDPSVLLTTAGMQQFKPYLTGKLDPTKDFGSKNVFSIQKCFRTTDIDEVGDETHNTFFEMVGNFSFGGYFKERAIALSFELLTSKEWLGLDPHRIYATAFKGDDSVPRDDEAIELWQKQFRAVGIEAKVGERIFLYGREKNWWEVGIGPSGPDAEMFYDRGLPHNLKFGLTCHPNCDCGRFVEIGNDVFVQYDKKADGSYEPLTQKAIDNGRGFERLVMILQNKETIFDTDLFMPLISVLPTASAHTMDERTQRIFADHVRGFSFLISDGVTPSNKGAGYVLRRLIRRVIVQNYLMMQQAEFGKEIGRYENDRAVYAMINECVQNYRHAYPELNEKRILEVFKDESQKFKKTMAVGLKELAKLGDVDAKTAFTLYESYGLPYEVVKELGGAKTKKLTREGFDEEFKKHQEVSRAGQEKKFGGHGLILDTGELKAGNKDELQKVLRLHTTTHLLQQALREVLGPDVHQMGSDITPERTRFDFSFTRKLTSDEIKRTEELVNKKIKEDLQIGFKEMSKAEAEKVGALHFFKEKYPEKVKVYYVGQDITSAWSKEFCGGPHVKHTGEIGHFRIAKEEAVGAGVRRVRGVVD